MKTHKTQTPIWTFIKNIDTVRRRGIWTSGRLSHVVLAKRYEENLEENVPKIEKYLRFFFGNFKKITKFLIVFLIHNFNREKQKRIRRPNNKFQPVVSLNMAH
jgi:hypothetical protein